MCGFFRNNRFSAHNYLFLGLVLYEKLNIVLVFVHAMDYTQGFEA